MLTVAGATALFLPAVVIQLAAQSTCRTKEKGGAMSNPSDVLVSPSNSVHLNSELA